MKKLTVIRTHLEIAMRITQVKADDPFGTTAGDLVTMLPYEAAKQFLANGATEDVFAAHASDNADIQHVAVKYLDFAIGKAVDHRGLSAVRSINHYQAWLWLLLPDDEYETFEVAGYAPYGVPQLKVAAHLLDAEAIWKNAELIRPELVRMAAGQPCEEDCWQGCTS